MGMRFLLPLLTLASCGGSEPARSYTTTPVIEAPDEPVHARGGRVVSAVIGPEGGTLELSSGAKFIVPEGALVQAVEVTLNVSTSSMAFNNREGEQALGPVIMVQPELTSSSGNFVVSVPVVEIPAGAEGNALVVAVEQPAEQQGAFEENGVRTVWSYENARAVDGRLEASLPIMPGYRLQFLYSP